MSKQTLNNGDSYSVIRSGLNSMFSELYSNNISVKIFGAVGDGITDDTLAIQSAIDSFGEYAGSFAGGGIRLYFPAGTYKISATLRIENNCRFIGDGSDQSTIISLADGSDCDMIIAGFEDSSDPITLHFEGFRMYMDATQQAAGYANIRCYNYIRHSHFNDLFLFGATDYNFVMEQKNGHQLGRNNYFYACAFEDALNGGCNINHDYNLNLLHNYFGFGNNDAVGYIGLRINMTAANLKVMHNWWLGDNYGYNLFISGTCRWFNISDNTFEADHNVGSGTAAVYLGSDCAYGVITGNVWKSTSPYDYCVRLNASTYINVHSNMFAGYSVSPIQSTDKSKQYIANNYNAQTDKRNESKGSSTISDGNTTVVVTHGCYAAPLSVVCTANKNEAIWVTNITSTQFTINRAGSSGDLIVYYNAYTN